MGYRLAILDPDPDCPAAAIADRVVVAAYDSVDGAAELARGCAVVTYELEHVDAALVEAVEAVGVPVRPGTRALRMTQDRLAERRFVASLGIATAPWREVTDLAGLRAAAAGLGTPMRLKAPLGGYDGRGQVRIATPADAEGAIERLGRPAGTRLLVEAELDFAAELSVITARAVDGALAAFAIRQTSTTPGPWSRRAGRRSPARWPPSCWVHRQRIEALDAVGLVTASRSCCATGSAVNELVPRVHNGSLDDRRRADQPVQQHAPARLRAPAG